MELTFLLLFVLCIMCATWVFISLVVYFIPVVVAYIRKHNSFIPIIILNIFLGWTFVGWLAALLWSLNSDVDGKSD